MSTNKEALLHLILPEGILDYFEVTKVNSQKEEIWIYLEELNNYKQPNSSDKLISKGFFPETLINDFPIRGKKVYLMVKRRRWLNMRTQMVVTRDWELVAKGTRYTQEFAAFFKEISR
ncbi:MAG: hypothetical protein PF481_00715 [Bacteroidales bacterium]|jgi:transposase|nr:hypothetical protein [Bacteroidales bacterium]